MQIKRQLVKTQPESVWAEISLSNAQYNFQAVKNAVCGAKICCVVKANAYGHGAEQLAKLYQQNKADYFAVSNVREALQLRTANIRLPILILGYTPPSCAPILAKNNISQCVFSQEYALALSKCAKEYNALVNVHVKIDTGMGRLGFDGKSPKKDISEIESVYKMPGLLPEGIFTHFSCADAGETGAEYTHRQFDNFCAIVDRLQNKGIDVGIRHCANSAALFAYPSMQMDMVRVGIALYGIKPSKRIKTNVTLKPILKLKTVIAFIKEIKAGETVGYGNSFRAKKNMKIATLPIGYGDGIFRLSATTGMVVEIAGQYARIVGKICMDQCMVDVTSIPNIQRGEEVTVYGESGQNSVEEIAKRAQTISYETLCAISGRVRRIYV